MKLNFALIGLAIFILGCQSGTPAPKTAGENVDDTWLHTKVKTELVGYGAGNVNIEVYRGEVQLAGFVDSREAKETLLQRTAGVSEVRKVQDQLVVVAPNRSAGRTLDDSVISAKVKSELGNNDLGRAFAVNVEVNRGRVLLSGFVADEEYRKGAIAAIKDLVGVEEVIDGMNIKPQG
jgi:hyperosmotically inducible protein